MAVSPHPSVKPSKPRKPPSDAGGQGSRESGQAGVAYGAKHEYGHSNEHSSQEYGHGMTTKTHGMGNHKSEFPGAEGGFPKAGDKSY